MEPRRQTDAIIPYYMSSARSCVVRKQRKVDKYQAFAKDALDLMGQKELQDLLDAAPPTKDPEELKIMEACRAVLATVREPVDG